MSSTSEQLHIDLNEQLFGKFKKRLMISYFGTIHILSISERKNPTYRLVQQILHIFELNLMSSTSEQLYIELNEQLFGKFEKRLMISYFGTIHILSISEKKKPTYR